jgi:hypothetical protein
MYLVTNQAKNTQVVVINKKEVYFTPLTPVELEKLSVSETELLRAVPMSIEEFEVPSSETVKAESKKAEVKEEKTVSSPENRISISDSLPISDSAAVSPKDTTDKAMSGLKAFGRKKK